MDMLVYFEGDGHSSREPLFCIEEFLYWQKR